VSSKPPTVRRCWKPCPKLVACTSLSQRQNVRYRSVFRCHWSILIPRAVEKESKPRLKPSSGMLCACFTTRQLSAGGGHPGALGTARPATAVGRLVPQPPSSAGSCAWLTPTIIRPPLKPRAVEKESKPRLKPSSGMLCACFTTRQLSAGGGHPGALGTARPATAVGRLVPQPPSSAGSCAWLTPHIIRPPLKPRAVEKESKPRLKPSSGMLCTSFLQEGGPSWSLGVEALGEAK
jgi:hypothetical protein